MGAISNEQLVLRIKAGENVADNMLQLWQQNKRLISSIAKRYKGMEEREDLEQQGYFGLCNAVNAYDSDGGTSFSTYAVFWIRQSMLRYIDECGKVVKFPTNVKTKMRQYKKMIAEIHKELGRNPTDEEAMYYLTVSYKKLQELKKDIIIDNMTSLDVPVGEEGNNTLCELVECPEVPEEDILDELQAEQLKKIIWELVDGLPGKCPQALKARYQEQLTFKETAKQLGITIEAARQWQNKGLKELRKPSRSRMLLPFVYDDYIYNQALHGNGVGNFNRTWTSSTERVALKL